MQNTKQELVLQVGQRTAGILEIFAEANNMTYEELRKTMEQGKTNTDMIVKAGLAAGKAADKMGTLAEAVKTGASAQQKWTNTMKWFSWAANKTLDPAIAAFFNTLADAITEASTPLLVLIKALARVIDSLITLTTVAKGMWDFINGIEIAKGAIGATSLSLAIFIAMCLAKIPMATNALDKMQKATKGLHLGMTVLGRLPVLMLFLALIELTRQLHDYYMGKTNWVSVLAITFQVAFAKIDLGVARFELMMARMEYAAKNTFKVITGLKWSELADKMQMLSNFWNPVPDVAQMREIVAQNRLTAEGKVTVDINVNDQNGTRQQTTTVPLNFTQSAAAQ